jgi:hypothetical protein
MSHKTANPQIHINCDAVAFDWKENLPSLYTLVQGLYHHVSTV